MSIKEISSEEVAKHNKVDDCWIVIGNEKTGGLNVYDVTEYLEDHPGGAEVLLDVGGQDADEFFEDIGHSKYARLVLKKYFIGTLKKYKSNDIEDVCNDVENDAEHLSNNLKSTVLKVDVDLHDKNAEKHTYYKRLANEVAAKLQLKLDNWFGDSDSINSDDVNSSRLVHIKVCKCDPGSCGQETCCGESKAVEAELCICWDISEDNNIVASGEKIYTPFTSSLDFGEDKDYESLLQMGEDFIFQVAREEVPRDIMVFVTDFLS